MPVFICMVKFQYLLQFTYNYNVEGSVIQHEQNLDHTLHEIIQHEVG